MTNRLNTLTGKILVALPSIGDPRFHRSVILICGHDEKGTLGLIINKSLPTFTFQELLDSLHIESKADFEQTTVHCGGYVEMGRGFVVHSPDYQAATTIHVTDDICLTATADILHAIVEGTGPHDVFLALGYAGWGSQQLEQEIIQNDWLVLGASTDLIFHSSLESRWHKALSQHGISAEMISLEGGSA